MPQEKEYTCSCEKLCKGSSAGLNNNPECPAQVEPAPSDTVPLTSMESGASSTPPGSSAGLNSNPERPAPVEPAPSNTVPARKKSGLFKFSKSSCAAWNLFGAEWAPKQPSPPTKDEVVEAYEKLSLLEKQEWAKIRKAALAEKKAV
ncbi:hypothetical protein FA13DRAFT_1791198 [Coprinellus micaceus]|uniref:Uncharacterized protein n=1 Tax=Coprinellus micaceus TaxID=71717 RepID=A0A4Y7TD60_COPMI|nr:hypothetical protein FA13DRAFT_1791198 [Coprinellus micaceus]